MSIRHLILALALAGSVATPARAQFLDPTLLLQGLVQTAQMAQQGNALAQTRMGQLLESGFGVTEMLGHSLQGGTAAVFWVRVQTVSALNVVVRALAVLLAFRRTPLKTCKVAEVVEPTATVLTVLLECKAAPLRTRLPVAGLLANETVTSLV